MLNYNFQFLFSTRKVVLAKSNFVPASFMEVGDSDRLNLIRGYASQEKLRRQLERKGD